MLFRRSHSDTRTDQARHVVRGLFVWRSGLPVRAAGCLAGHSSNFCEGWHSWRPDPQISWTVFFSIPSDTSGETARVPETTPPPKKTKATDDLHSHNHAQDTSDLRLLVNSPHCWERDSPKPPIPTNRSTCVPSTNWRFMLTASLECAVMMALGTRHAGDVVIRHDLSL